MLINPEKFVFLKVFSIKWRNKLKKVAKISIMLYIFQQIFEINNEVITVNI